MPVAEVVCFLSLTVCMEDLNGELPMLHGYNCYCAHSVVVLDEGSDSWAHVTL